MANAILSAARVRQLFDYDPKNGALTWAVDRSRLAKKGTVAGSVYSNGYRVVGVDQTYYLVHRLVWVHHYGEPPKLNVDHINGDRLDNRIANLRDVSKSKNAQNQRKCHGDKKSCDLIGATWDKSNKNWKAQLVLNRKTVYIGRFKTPEDAHAAYLEAKRKLHSGCTL